MTAAFDLEENKRPARNSGKPRKKSSRSERKGKNMSMESAIDSIHTDRPVKEKGKKSRFGFRLPWRKKTAVEQRADELGISASELVSRYLELGMQIDKYFDPGESQLVVLDPREWKRGKEVAIPFEQIIGDT